jgi:outer membrane protein TolC
LAIDRLRRSIGLPYAEGCDAGQVKLSQSWPNPRVNESLGDLLLQGLAKRPELAALASEIQAAKSAVGFAKAVHRPRVELFGTYGAQSLRFSGNASDLINGTTGGVRVVVPLVDLGRTRGQVEQANARLQQIQAREDQQRLDIEGQVRQAFFDYDEASQILDTSQLVVKQANEALRLAQNRFEAGALTQLEILQSRLELTRAQLEEVQSLHTYNLAVARLRQAVGSIARESAAAPVLP